MRNKSNTFKIRHTSGAAKRLEEANRLMGMSNQLSVELEAIFNHWTRVRISDPELKKLIQLAMVPNKEVLRILNTDDKEGLSTVYRHMVDNVYEYAMSSPTQATETTKGTVFGAYNAVTGYFQNVRRIVTGKQIGRAHV